MLRNLALTSLFLALSPWPSLAGETSEKILYQKNSVYQYIAVVEDTAKKERYIINMKRDYNQGGISVDAPDELLFEYTQMSFISLAFLDREPDEVLFVGLGAGSMPRYFNRHYPGVSVDVAEIDPDILDVAKRYFHYKETPEMKVHISDGRVFIKRARKKYDIVFLDAYQNDYIPFHLTTVEFLREVKSKLSRDGVVVSNITSPFRNKFFYSMIETYKKEFPHLYIFKGEKSANYIFVAAQSGRKKDSSKISKRAKKIQEEKKLDFDLHRVGWALYGYYTEYDMGGKVLTDDFAPVNLYRHMRAE